MNDPLQARLLAADATAELPPVCPVRVADLAVRARRRALGRGVAATCAIAVCALVWPLLTPATLPAATSGLAELHLRAQALLEISAPDHAAIRAVEAAHVRAASMADRALALAATVSTPR